MSGHPDTEEELRRVLSALSMAARHHIIPSRIAMTFKGVLNIIFIYEDSFLRRCTHTLPHTPSNTHAHIHMHQAFTYTFIKLVNSTRLPALRTLILQNICLDTEARKAVLTALPVPKFGGNKPKGRGQAALMIHNPSSSSNSTSSTSLHTSFKPTTSTRTMLTLRPATPLLQLEHLVLRDICPIRPTWLQALFDCLAYHRVPLQTLECCRLYHCEGEVSMYDGLAAHLKIGNFPTLSSLTIYENGMRASAAVALIGGLDQGCPAVTSLSLESNYGRSSDYVSECGLLIKALSQASGHLHLSLQTPGLEELDVAEASEVLL